MKNLLIAESDKSVPIWPVAKPDFDAWLANQSPAVQQWLKLTKFEGEENSMQIIPDASGEILGVVTGLGDSAEFKTWSCAHLPSALPAGTYRLEVELSTLEANQVCLGWLLGTYSYQRYKSEQPEQSGGSYLVAPHKCDVQQVLSTAETISLVRDMINTPAADMGPADLENAVNNLAQEHGGKVTSIAGDDLLTQGLPLIHAVGRASNRAPRLIDLCWGPSDAVKITLVGKGVCFDSGGIQVKSDPGIRGMKKDMGGAAHALGLAKMIMEAGLKVNLRLLIPAVDNSISANNYLPGDVFKTRNGVTVEIEHTDAEGRLILADALAVSSENKPDLVVDFGTLTGAAEEALGYDIPAIVSDKEEIGFKLQQLSKTTDDPVWPLPLWRPYTATLKGKIADTNHIADGAGAGVITCALFLNKFVRDTGTWVHVDLSGWSPQDRPGRPEGGEALGLRTLFSYIKEFAG